MMSIDQSAGATMDAFRCCGASAGDDGGGGGGTFGGHRGRSHSGIFISMAKQARVTLQSQL